MRIKIYTKYSSTNIHITKFNIYAKKFKELSAMAYYNNIILK